MFPQNLNLPSCTHACFSESDATEAKTIQSCQFYPLDLHIPHLTRFDPVEDIELQAPNRFSIQ